MGIQTIMISAAMVLFATSKMSVAVLSCTKTSTEVDTNRCYEAFQMMCHNNSESQEISCRLDNRTLLVQSSQTSSLHRNINFHTLSAPSNPVFTALSLCYVEALTLQANDLSCGQECKTRNIETIRNRFDVKCSYFFSMIKNLTIILFRLRKPVGTELCANLSDYKFALINITGKPNKNTMTLSVMQE